VQDFKNADVLDLGHVRRLDTLLEALESGMPADAVVYVEGVAFADDVRAALSALSQVPKKQQREDLEGTFWPSPLSFHLPVGTGVLGRLRGLEKRHAEPEICDHLAVYRGEEILALAHDATGGKLLVGRRTLAPEAVEKMRRIVERDAGEARPAQRVIDRVRRVLRRRR
jgi:hypothetical protein